MRQQNSKDYLCLLLESTRSYYGISISKLVEGICSRSYYSRVQSGEREMDYFMACALFERLGKDMGRFEQALDLSEYEMFEKRQAIRADLRNGDIAKAERDIDDYMGSMSVRGNDKMHTQFALFMRTHVAKEKKRPAEEQIGMVKEALSITFGRNLDSIKNGDVCLTVIEALLFLRLAVLEDAMGLHAESESHIAALYRIWQKPMYCGNRQVDAYAPVIYRMALRMLVERDYMNSDVIATTGIKALMDNGSLYYMSDLLMIKMKCGCSTLEEDKVREQFGNSDNYRWYKELDACMQDMKDWDPLTFYPMYVEVNIIPVTQLVKQRRTVLGITKRKLSQLSFCDISTIDRIEGEKHSTQGVILRHVLEALKLGGQKGSMGIIFEDYDVCIKYEEIIGNLKYNRMRDVEMGVRELKQKISQTSAVNNQRLDMLSHKVSKMKMNIQPDDSLYVMRSALGHTLPASIVDNMQPMHLYSCEREILKMIADCYWELDQKDKCMHIVDTLMTQYRDRSEYANVYVRIAMYKVHKLEELGDSCVSQKLYEECKKLGIIYNINIIEMGGVIGKFEICDGARSGDDQLEVHNI